MDNNTQKQNIDLPTSMENKPVISEHDPWTHQSIEMKCTSCMYYKNFRCKRHAPTMQGYPAVYPHLDWCGDHKMDKEHMNAV